MMPTQQNPTEEKTWQEFRESGLLWWINSLLHMFGWAIGFEADDDGNVQRVFPMRVAYRGFNQNSNDRGYRKVTSYLQQNIDQLEKEAYEREE